MLEIFVKTATGKTRALRLLARDTAAGAKNKLQSEEGIPQEEQRLIFAGKELRDDALLIDAGLQLHSTMELVLRLQGGGPNCSRLCGRELPRPADVTVQVEDRGPRRGEPAAAPAPAQDRKALPLLDGVVGGRGMEAIVSFPGKYQDTWNDMVATVLLLKYLAKKMKLREDQVPRIWSTACIFLPDGDENFGKHHPNDVDPVENDAGHCFCHKLYGEQKDWGCQWFHVWRGKLEEVLKRGQTPVVVYKAGEVGEGDATSWENFPISFSTEHRGLGGSQKGEVAHLKRELEKRGIAHFEKRDVREVSKTTLEKSYRNLNDIISGSAGGEALADAIEHCKEVQDALGTLSLGMAQLGEVGGTALARSLPRLRSLQKLVLRECALGEGGSKAVATSLQHLPKLVSLNLANNYFCGKAGQALAANLRHLPKLQVLRLYCCEIREVAGLAIAASLQHVPKLSKLDLGNNGLGKEVGRAVAARLQYLPELEVLRLDDNRLGEEAGKALAGSLHHLPMLSELSLAGNQLEGEAGKALAASLRNLPKLSKLYLERNQLGDEGGKALTASLQHVPELKELGLQGDELGDFAGVALAASLEQLPLLKNLDLRYNSLGERAKNLLREKWGTRDARRLEL